MNISPMTSNAEVNLFFVLLPTLECNLRCKYCFEEHTALQWDLQQARRVLEEIFTLLRTKAIHHCKLHWQGGEPLIMGVEFWQTIFSMVEQMARESDISLLQSMQTNLTLYRSNFAPIVHKHLDGVLGTSFELSCYRCFPGGDVDKFRSTWRKAYKNATEDGIEVGVLCMLDEESTRMGFKEYINILREEFGVYKVRFILPFSPSWARSLGFWIDPDMAGEFMSEGFRVWHAHGGDDWMEIRPFKYLFERFQGGKMTESGLCIFTRNCVDLAMTILPDGKVTLCDNFTHPASCVSFGNVFSQSLVEIFDGEERKKIKDQVYSLLNEQCTSCRYISYCYGGCLVRSRYDEKINNLKYHYCESYKQLYRAIEETVTGNGPC
jgi:uncharacterized protein